MGPFSLLSLITILQYSLFGGIVLVLFGLFEKKEKLAYVGNSVFILLGVLSAWLLATNDIHIPATNIEVIPKEVKVLSLLKLSLWVAALNLISLGLGIVKNKYYRVTLFLIVLAALGLFFVAFNLLQTPVNQ
jgi:hypothetical protein